MLKLVRKANTYDKAAIEAIINTISSSTNNRLNRISELHLTSSYIHIIISSIFGSYNSVPHCSNLLPCETATKSKERPDYIYDKYTNHEYDYSTVYGKIKTGENTSSVNQNLYRLAYFTKNAIDTNNLEMTQGFQATGTTIHSYAMTLQYESVHVFMDIATLKIPTQRVGIRKLLLELDKISQLAHLHDKSCKPIENTIPHSPTISYELYDIMDKQCRGKKRDIE